MEISEVVHPTLGGILFMTVIVEEIDLVMRIREVFLE